MTIKDFTPIDEEIKMLDRLITEYRMTEIQIKVLSNTFMKPFRLMDRRTQDLWTGAFHLYNVHNSSKLHMGCVPCYHKVLMFHNAQYKMQVPPTTETNKTK